MSTNNNPQSRTPSPPHQYQHNIASPTSSSPTSSPLQTSPPPLSPQQQRVGINNQYGNQIPRTNNLIINQNQGPINPVVPVRTNVSTVVNQNQHFQMISNMHQQQMRQQQQQQQQQYPPPPPQQQQQYPPPPPPPQQRSPPQQIIIPNRTTSPPPTPARSSVQSNQSSNVNFGPRSPNQKQLPGLPTPMRSKSKQVNPQQQPQQQQQPFSPTSPRQQTGPPPVRQQSNMSQNSQHSAPAPPLRQQSNNSQNALPMTTPTRTFSASNNNNNNNSRPIDAFQSGLSQRKQLPKPPSYDPNPGIMRNKSFGTNSLSRSASNLKTKFANMMNRVPSLRRTFSTKERSKSLRRKRLSISGGIGVSTMYENSKKGKPIFENQLLKKPQNPNFIIALGIIVMISAVTLSIGLIAKYSGGLSEADIHDITEMDVQGFIFFSLFLIIIAVTGCIAYYKKWTSLLLTFSVFIVFAFVVQMIIIFLFLNIYTNPVVQMRNKWIDALTDQEKVIYQDNNSCCGFLSVSDSVMSSKCFPDEGQTTLTKFPAKYSIGIKVKNTGNTGNKLFRRQDQFMPGAVQPDPVQPTQPDPVQPDTVQPDTVQPDTVQPDTTVQDQTGQDQFDDTSIDPSLTGVDAQDPKDAKEASLKRDPNSYTEADIQKEGCANVILHSIKTGLIQYIITECIMAILFMIALYFAAIHFKEQILMPKKLNLDAAKVTFG